jgi:hypothetical protein
LVQVPEADRDAKKKGRVTDRPYTTALYALRCVQLGLSLTDLDQLDYGMVVDIMTEANNDNETYNYVATQEDMDRF